MTFVELLKNHSRLQEENQALQRGQKQLIQENEALKNQLQYLQSQVAMLNRKFFGRSSEKLGSDPHQMPLFDLGDSPVKAAPPLQVASHERKASRPGHGRGALPEGLPIVERELQPEEDVSRMKRIGEDVRDILEFKPAQFYIIRLIRPKYAEAKSDRIVQAPMPHLPIPRGIPGPNLLAHMSVSKFVDHLPLDRQLKQYQRLGVDLPPSTVNGWLNKGVRDMVEPLWLLLKDRVGAKVYLQVDETTTKVQTDAVKGKLHRGYFWLYYSPLDGEVFYEYKSGRGRDGPKDILAGFQGWLQTDGYKVYDEIGKRDGIRHVACMAHARREFHDILKDYGDQQVLPVLKLFKKLYKVESDARNHHLSHEERRAMRQKKSKPIMDEIKTWLAEQVKTLTPSDPVAGAIGYMQNRWEALTLFLDEGQLEIDNNPVENKVRPIPLGRKNWLFHGNDKAAETAAMMYTLVAHAKNAGLNPHVYLATVFTRFWDTPKNQLDQLLPKNIKLN